MMGELMSEVMNEWMNERVDGCFQRNELNVCMMDESVYGWRNVWRIIALMNSVMNAFIYEWLI